MDYNDCSSASIANPAAYFKGNTVSYTCSEREFGVKEEARITDASDDESEAVVKDWQPKPRQVPDTLGTSLQRHSSRAPSPLHLLPDTYSRPAIPPPTQHSTPPDTLRTGGQAVRLVLMLRLQ